MNITLGKLPPLRIDHNPELKYPWRLSFQNKKGKWTILYASTKQENIQKRFDNMIKNSMNNSIHVEGLELLKETTEKQ